MLNRNVTKLLLLFSWIWVWTFIQVCSAGEFTRFKLPAIKRASEDAKVETDMEEEPTGKILQLKRIQFSTYS